MNPSRSVFSLTVAVLFPLMVCGCASAPLPTASQRIMILASPPRATVSLIGSPARLDTPCAMDVPSSGRAFLRVEKEGFETSFIEVNSSSLTNLGEVSSAVSWTGDQVPPGAGYSVLRVTLKPSPDFTAQRLPTPDPPPPALIEEQAPPASDIASPPVSETKVKKTRPAKPAVSKAKPKTSAVKPPRPPKAQPASDASATSTVKSTPQKTP